MCKDLVSPVFDTHQDVDVMDDAYCSLRTHLEGPQMYTMLVERQTVNVVSCLLT